MTTRVRSPPFDPPNKNLRVVPLELGPLANIVPEHGFDTFVHWGRGHRVHLLPLDGERPPLARLRRHKQDTGVREELIVAADVAEHFGRFVVHRVVEADAQQVLRRAGGNKRLTMENSTAMAGTRCQATLLPSQQVLMAEMYTTLAVRSVRSSEALVKVEATDVSGDPTYRAMGRSLLNSRHLWLRSQVQRRDISDQKLEGGGGEVTLNLRTNSSSDCITVRSGRAEATRALKAAARSATDMARHLDRSGPESSFPLTSSHDDPSTTRPAHHARQRGGQVSSAHRRHTVMATSFSSYEAHK